MRFSHIDTIRCMCSDFILFSLTGIILFYAFPFIFKLTIPFILGFFIYLFSRGIEKRLEKYLSPFFSSLLAIIIVSAVFLSALFILFYNLFTQLYGFSESFPALFSSVEEKISSLSVKAFLPDFTIQKIGGMTLGKNIKMFFENKLLEIINHITDFVLDYAKNIPSAILTVFTALFFAFFLLKDRNIFIDFLKNLLGADFCKLLFAVKNSALLTVTKYVRAQFFVSLCIFSVLFMGLVILKRPYALLCAFLIALLDSIPIFGTGSVLIPWSIIEFISGNSPVGRGLLILYGLCVFTRQIAEPKIIGVKFGIHPLISMVSIYTGAKLFGFTGLILGPCVALFIKGLTEKRCQGID